jgi:hypothetical protein
VSFLATSLLFRHPAAQCFAEAVLRDEALRSLFVEQEGSGWSTLIHQSTGRGGGLQLTLLPEMILQNAWAKLEPRARSPERFADAAQSVWELVRKALVGDVQPITARFAFTGIVVPSATNAEFGDGVIRAATDGDRRVAPESLRHQLTGTDAQGRSTTVNYDGDVVFETEVPYVVVAGPPPTPNAEPPAWPAEAQPPRDVEGRIARLRSSLLLAVRRDHRVQLVPSWRHYDDPLTWGHATSWFDSRSTVGLTPTTLTEDEIEDWCRWYDLLSAPSVRRIDVALNRVLRAVSERRDPSDVLIDSVIAWENLFGTSEGEPTLRVTSSLALLLEGEVEQRVALRSKLAKIYSLRSKVVHGSHEPSVKEVPVCYEALEIAIRALQIVFERRLDLLDLPDGGARSLRLILEG